MGKTDSINSRIKNWGALQQVWQHGIDKHGAAFRVLAIVSQLSINSVKKLFACGCQPIDVAVIKQESTTFCTAFLVNQHFVLTAEQSLLSDNMCH